MSLINLIFKQPYLVNTELLEIAIHFIDLDMIEEKKYIEKVDRFL